MNKGTYVNFEGKTVEFNYSDRLSLAQKTSFAMEVANMVVSKDIGYASVLERPMFDYCLMKYLTDIVLFEDDNDFSLDMIEQFFVTNGETVIVAIKKALGEQIYELQKACEDAIEFRKSHFSDYHDEIGELLQVVREYVAKPDYMSELLIAGTNMLNSFADRGNIDMSVVNKLADIVPVMKELGGKEVAKAIIEDYHKNDTVDEKTEDKPKSKAKRGRKPRTAQTKEDTQKQTTTDKTKTKEASGADKESGVIQVVK